MKPKLMSTQQQQLHSGHRTKIKRGFVLSVLTTLVFRHHLINHGQG
jgi:hypothetical protein